ncbi:MAG: alanine--tRNA ligase-related protein, partial [bacterium]|nr:alanine--tRNA ligase-related protein [bacterium]
MIEKEFSGLKKGKIISGEIVFKLYDTFGFPADLTELIASEKGFTVDQAGFETEMEKQKARGKKAWKGSGQAGAQDIYHTLQKKVQTQFVGYDHLTLQSPIVTLLQGNQPLKKASAGDEIEVITQATPFYPEGGGQVGDRGFFENKKIRFEVQDTQKPVEGIIVHRGRLIEGTLQEGDEMNLSVDPVLRQGSENHHSATHLLHAALRKTLGEHVRQGGSLVTPHRLRFDFTHFEPVTREKVRQIEDLVNEQIRRNLQVIHEILPYDEAIKKGALAFFGEKYGAKVRTCQMGNFSFELCGGTHVKATGEIGFLKILGESSVAAGTRRIEAVVGGEAL